MSKQVDEKVVSMQFDNKQFEEAARTSMSTLDKLKSKLKLDGAAKGFEEIDGAASKVKFTGLISGLESVAHKFTALDVLSFTVMQNITNQAIATGKKVVNAITFAPISDGFKEYETQMNAVQTILANTKKEGTNVKIVNKYLDELNHYADMTIYNFTEMTRNIGTFTAAGVKLETSVSSIKGIANLAAVSGSTSQQASTAMYQLSQAIAAGTVKLMDWNSVVNAGMGGQVFQDALIRTSEHLKTGAKAAIAAEGSFRESLKDGWLTTEVLTETLRQFQLNTESQQEYNKSVQELINSGYTAQEAKEIADMAKTASEAATKVKTFTQLIDTLKEALGSGWTKTWQLVIGDFDDARALWTSVSDVLSNIINTVSDSRNALLEAAMGSPLGKLADTIKSVTGATEGMIQITKDYGEVVDQIINGQFGNGQKRFKALAEAGYDWAYAQNLVNKRLGSTVEHATDYKEAQNGVQEATAKTVEELCNMTAQQLLSSGYTTDQIVALRELAKQSEKTGIPINDLAADLDQLNGRNLLIDSFKNMGESLIKTFTAIGLAWKNTFKQLKPDDIYNLITAFHKLTERIKVTDEDAEKIERTFRGLFAAIDLVTTIFGGGFKLAIKVIQKLLEHFNLDLLDVTAYVGDMIVQFRDFVENNGLVEKAIDTLANGLIAATDAAKEFYEFFKQLPVIQESIQKLSELDLSEIGGNIIDGLNNGLWEKSGSIIDTIKGVAENLITTFKEILGIHSPSTVFFSFGEFIIDGLVNGFKSASSGMYSFLDDMTGEIIDKVGGVNWGTVLGAGASVALIATVKKLADAFSVLSGPIKGVNSLFTGLNNILNVSAKPIAKTIKSFSKVLKGFAHVLNSISLDISAKAFIKLAIAVGILVAALFILTKIDQEKLKAAIISLAEIAGILSGLAIAAGLFAKSSVSLSKAGASVNSVGVTLLSIAGAIGLMMLSFKMASEIDPGSVQQAEDIMLLMAGSLAVMAAAIIAVSSKHPVGEFKGLGTTLLKMTLAMLLMVGVFKAAGTLNEKEITQGTYLLGTFTVFMSMFSLCAGMVTGAGKTALAMSASLILLEVAMGLLVGVFKLVNTLNEKEIQSGIAFAAGVLVFLTGLQLIGMIPSKGFSELSKTLLAVSVSMVLLAAVMKITGSMSPKEIIKGIACTTALIGMMALMMLIVKAFGSDAPKMAATLMGISVAIGVLAMVAVALSFVKPESMAKGIVAVGALAVIMSGLMLACKFVSGNAKVSLIAMVAAIAVLAAAVIALSFIDPAKLAAPVAALAVLMTMFGVMAAMSSLVKGGTGTMIALTALVAVMAGALYLLSSQDWKSVLASAAAIMLVLGTLSAMMVVMASVGAAASLAIPATIIMGVLLAGVTITFLALKDLDPDGTLKIALALSAALLTLGATCAILTVVGAAAVPALVGIGVLMTLVAAIASFMVIIGELMTAMPNLEQFLDKGIVVLQKVGEGIGAFFGNIVGGFLDGVTSKLVDVADNLSAFVEHLKPFIDGVNSFGSESATAIKDLAAAILVLTAAELLNGINKFMGGKQSISDFADQLIPFGKAMVDFGNAVEGLDAGKVRVAAKAGEALAEMAKSLPATGGIFQKIFGEKDMTEFGKSLVAFGTAMMMYAVAVTNLNTEAITNSVEAGKSLTDLADTIPSQNGVLQQILGEKDMGNFGLSLAAFGTALSLYALSVKDLDTAAITSSATAAKKLTDMADTLPRKGGIFEGIFGKKDMDTFGESLVSFGQSLYRFSLSAEYVNAEKVDEAASCSKALAELCNSLPEKGFLSGKMSLKDFAKTINKFAELMTDFHDLMSNVNLSDIPDLADNVDRITAMLKNMSGIQTDGVNSFIYSMENLGKTGIDSFISALDHAGPEIFSAAENIFTTFSKALNEKSVLLKSTLVGSVMNAVQAVANDTAALQSVADLFTYSLTLGIGVGSENVKSCIEALISKMQLLFNSNMFEFANWGAAISVNIGSGIRKNSGKIKDQMERNIQDLLQLVKDRSEYFELYAKNITDELSSGLNNHREDPINEMRKIVRDCINAVRNSALSFRDAGEACVIGFCNGITENTFRAEAQAAAMALKAYQAAKEALGVHSPSRVFKEIGEFVVQGFANGIKNTANESTNAVTFMAQTAVNNAMIALSGLDKAVNSELNLQPVITPVVDMSDVNTTALQLSTGLSLSFNDPMNSLNSVILRAQQEIIRSNDMVIEAITDLRQDVAQIAENGFPEVSLYADSTKLASTLAKPIDKQLAVLAERRNH